MKSRQARSGRNPEPGWTVKEGLARYRLYPLRGWQIVATPGNAFLLVVTVLALPLSLLTARAAALAALAAGNAASLRLIQQKRWRFSRGPGIVDSVVQVGLLTTAGGGSVPAQRVRGGAELSAVCDFVLLVRRQDVRVKEGQCCSTPNAFHLRDLRSG